MTILAIIKHPGECVYQTVGSSLQLRSENLAHGLHLGVSRIRYVLKPGVIGSQGSVVYIENAEEESQSMSALSPRVWEKDPEEKTGKGAGSNICSWGKFHRVVRAVNLGEKVNFKVKLSKLLMTNAPLKWNLRLTIGVCKCSFKTLALKFAKSCPESLTLP